MLSFQDKIQPVKVNTTANNPLSFADKITPVESPTTETKSPGVIGSITNGIWDAGKGLLQLTGSAAYDTYQAINHPIDSAKNVADFIGGELTGGQPAEKLDTLGSFIQSTVGSKGLLGVAQLPGKVIKSNEENKNKASLFESSARLYTTATQFLNMARAETDPVKKANYLTAYQNNMREAENIRNEANGIKPLTQGEIAGTTLNGALTALTFGRGNIATSVVDGAVEKGLLTSTVGNMLKELTNSFVSKSLQTGGIMAGYQVAGNLNEGRPIDENLKESFFSGLALPGVIKVGGKIINKTAPSSLTQEAGAIQLKKAIGFRGNAKEKIQYDKSVPVVYNDLQQSGFKLSDSTDPNNIITLDRAVNERMTDILAERTTRIAETGQDTMIKGSLAADKIKSLITPGSVEDLINPSMREKLDAVAKNFENKEYTPVEAQQAIQQANTGFSFSDNPAMASKIKMAISEAFTPELDRIVAGIDKIAYDQKGKPIPAPKGTAELNKKWSAYKTFKTQLDKKITLEERRALNSLPDRLTGAQVAGKVGEAVGNPMVLPQKAMGGAFEYLANKIMGDRNNVNFRIYKAFNGSQFSLALVSLLNKFKTVDKLIELIKQNPLIRNILEKVIDMKPLNDTEAALVEKAKETPNTQGGFISIGDNNLLIKEARKYKSAEEFVNQFEFSGRSKNENVLKAGESGVYTTANENFAKKFGDNSHAVFIGDKKILDGDSPEGMKILETALNKVGDNATDKQIFNEVKKLGYDGIRQDYIGGKSGMAGNGVKETILFNDTPALAGYTKSQLTDIWNKANKSPNSQAGLGKLGAIAGGSAVLSLGMNALTQITKPQEKKQDIPKTIYNEATSNAEKTYGIKFPKMFLEAIREQESSNIDDPNNLRLSMGLTDIAMKALGKNALPNTSMKNVMQNAANYLALRATHKPKDGGPDIDLTKPENWVKWYVQKYVGLLPGETRKIRGEDVPYQRIYNEFKTILNRLQNGQK